MSKKVAISYARNSGAHTQTELSIKEQIVQIRRYADENGITLIQEFQEKHSAFRREKWATTTGRKVFQEVLEFIKKNRIDHLLIFKWDRITRLDKEFVLLEETCEKNGVRVIAITEDYGALGPMANFSIRNSRNLAQLYSEELSFKAKLGMRRAMLEWKHSGSVIPIGYIKLAKNKAIIDPERAAFVKRAFELYATGTYSYLSLSDKLSKEGFTTQDSKPVDNKRIEAILRQDIYTGFKTMTWKLKPYEVQYFGATKPGPFTETYTLDIEPIISRELYKKVASIRSGRSNYEKHEGIVTPRKKWKKTRYFLFQWAFKCSCGRAVSGYKNERKWITYYQCNRSISTHFPEKCPEKAVNEKELYNLMRRRLMRYRFSDEYVRNVRNKINNSEKDNKTVALAQMNELRWKAWEIEIKRMDLTEKYVEKKISDENYSLLDEKYRSENTDLLFELSRLESFSSNQGKNRDFVVFFMWLREQLEAVTEPCTVRFKSNTLTRASYFKSNQILTCKKPLPIAESGLLHAMRFWLIPIWLRRYESNVRPQGYEPCELPLLYSAVWLLEEVSELYRKYWNCKRKNS